jgi:hypothetical protein
LLEELANWKPGMDLPDIPIEDVSEELDRHVRETNFQARLFTGTIQGCRMVCFQTKNPTLGKFWRVLQ